jgi:hypothetical protein
MDLFATLVCLSQHTCAASRIPNLSLYIGHITHHTDHYNICALEPLIGSNPYHDLCTHPLYYVLHDVYR